MDEIEERTCIRYKFKTSEADYIFFKSTLKRCSSKLGRVGRRQDIFLKTNCIKRKKVVHELLHALGLSHIQNQSNRDKFVTIEWDNINPKKRNNFVRRAEGPFSSKDNHYDFYSVMHYSSTAFAKSKGLKTIVPHNSKYLRVMGKVKKLSKGDIRRINEMYDC